MSNAIADALHTATKQLATEHAALVTLAGLGYTDGSDVRTCQTRIADLSALIARIEARIAGGR